ncbi:MAG: hypothetical protein IPO93_04495 [Actinobacteria bacterium]|nr:hypothetical protein [Actinomycetota bacterium]
MAVTAIATAAVVMTPTPAQAANGSLTGTVPAAPSPQLATYYRPAVVAYRLDQPGDVRTVDPSPGATYRLKVPAGLWAVQTPRWVNGVLDPASQVVPVAGGRTVAVRARADAPPPIRISAAEWTSSGLAEPEITGGIGDLMINDLVTGAEKCNTASGGRGVAVVEDRQGHRWRDVLREIKLGMSRYADPEFRAMAKRATVNIKAWAPTHRLVGHMSQSGDTFTATASLVNTKTGKTQWTKTYTVPATGDGFFGLSDTLPADVMRELCKPVAPLRVTITGRLTLASAPVNASADVALQYDAAPIKGDETNFSPTEPATWQVSSTAATATDPECRAVVERVDPGPPMFAPSVLAHKKDDGSYTVFVTSAINLWISLPGDGGGCLDVAVPVFISGAVMATGQTMVTVTRAGAGSSVGPQTFRNTETQGDDNTWTSSLTVTVTENH